LKVTATLGIPIVPYAQSFMGDRARDVGYVRRLAAELIQSYQSGAIAAVKMMIFADSPADGDRNISNRLLDALQGVVAAVVVDCLQPEDAFREIVTARWLLASRFHSVMFAYLLARPMIAIPYQPKCLALTREIGLPETAVVFPEDVLDGAGIGNAIARMAAGDLAFNSTVPVESSRVRSQRALYRCLTRLFAVETRAVAAPQSLVLAEEPAIET
jgi:polysaccharide pyruvyl transferase WcaK-like protein